LIVERNGGQLAIAAPLVSDRRPPVRFQSKDVGRDVIRFVRVVAHFLQELPILRQLMVEFVADGMFGAVVSIDRRLTGKPMWLNESIGVEAQGSIGR